MWGEDAGARQTVRIKGVKGKYQKHPFKFTAGAGTEKAMLEILTTGGDVLVGTVSLMPADNVRGMRPDTLDLLKQLGGTMYRWPGGNFVSGYNWRDGIGDRDRRPPRKNPAWTGVEHNDFGIDEFIDFCREIGTEPVIAVNTGFGDDYSAAQEVEYCNRGTDTIGGILAGQERPQEALRRQVLVRRQRNVRTLATGLHAVEPLRPEAQPRRDRHVGGGPVPATDRRGQLREINRNNDPEQKYHWTEGMLRECANYMNYISEHFYRGRTPWSPENPDVIGHVNLLKQSIIQKAEGHRTLQKALGLLDTRPVPIAMDEWNYWHQPYVYGELGCQYDLADALGVAIGLHEYSRNSDIIKMAHYAQTVNVIGCIKTTKTDAFFDATALPLMLYRHHYGSIPIEVEGDHAAAALDVAAAWADDRKAVAIAVVNPNRQSKALEIKLDGIQPQAKGTGWIIAGDEPTMHNDANNERLQIIEVPVQWEDRLEVAPLSITLVRFPVD